MSGRHVPEREYLFKHALTQEAAYASILSISAAELHRRLAIFLEQEATPPRIGQPLLAHIGKGPRSGRRR